MLYLPPATCNTTTLKPHLQQPAAYSFRAEGLSYSEDGVSVIFWNSGSYLPNCKLNTHCRHNLKYQTVKLELIIYITCLLTPWRRVLLEKLTGLQLVKKFPAFMEPEGSSPHSQAHATCPYPELAPSSPHTHIPLPEDPS